MPRISKTKQQLIILVVVIVLIVAALAYMVLSGSSEAAKVPVYTAPSVQKDFNRAVFDNPEYVRLENPPISLPLDPGPKGRENPFEALP